MLSAFSFVQVSYGLLRFNSALLCMDETSCYSLKFVSQFQNTDLVF